MKHIFLGMALLLLGASCMKTRDEYQEAITTVHEERQEEIQREEALEKNPERARGENDAEGMGMDEAFPR